MRDITRLSLLVLLLTALPRASAEEAPPPKELEKELGAGITRTIEEELREPRAPGHISRAVFGLPDAPEPPNEATPLTASEAERHTGTYTHAELVRLTVSWDGRQLVLKTDSEQPLERIRPDTFRTKDGQELAFVFKPGQTKARYLHMDLLTTVRSGK